MTISNEMVIDIASDRRVGSEFEVLGGIDITQNFTIYNDMRCDYVSFNLRDFT